MTTASRRAWRASVSAATFTVGSDIFFGAGQFDPGSLDGDRVLGHEIAHVLDGPGPTGVVRRAMKHYKKGYDGAYQDGYVEGYSSGMDELVEKGAIVKQAAKALVAEAMRAPIGYAAGWDANYKGTYSEGDDADFDDGQEIANGLAFDHGFEEAMKLGYSRAYSAIPSQSKALVLAENGNVCAYCGAQPSADVDHIRSLKWHWQVQAIRKQDTLDGERGGQPLRRTWSGRARAATGARVPRSCWSTGCC